MLESLAAFNVVTQAFVATTATSLLTAVGTLPVLFFRSAPRLRGLMDAMMGFAAAVMAAASCWSLPIPAIDLLNVMIALHESLGVEVPEQDYAKLSTLNSAVDYLAARLEA